MPKANAILLYTLCLTGFGLVMIYSTSAYKGELMFGNSLHWFLRQSLWAIVGMSAMGAAARFDYRILERRSRILFGMYGAMSLLLVLTLILGSVTNGSKRWLSLGPFSFQPSEPAKLILILFMAYVMQRYEKAGKSIKGTFGFLLSALPIVGPVAVENASTSIIMLGIVGFMIFAASPKYKRFFFLLGVGALLASVIIGSRAYRLERFVIWLDPENHPKGFQTMQGLYGIGSGGLFGKGLGKSMQKLGFLPEPQNDMIFSIICEELGLTGALGVLFLFFLLQASFFETACSCGDLFGFLIVMGVSAHIGIQVFVNIAVVTNTIPNTGVPLPFISYGGSSLFFLLMEIGMVLSVKRYSTVYLERR